MQKKGNDEKLYTLQRGRSPLIYKATLRCKSGFTLGRGIQQEFCTARGSEAENYMDEVESFSKLLTVTAIFLVYFLLRCTSSMVIE